MFISISKQSLNSGSAHCRWVQIFGNDWKRLILFGLATEEWNIGNVEKCWNKFGEAKVCRADQVRKIFCKSYDWKWSFRLVCKLNYLQFGLQKYRSSHSQMYFRIGALKDFAMFTEKHLCWSLYLITVQAWMPVTLLRRDSVKFAKFLRTPIFTEHIQWLLLEKSHELSLYCIWEQWMVYFVVIKYTIYLILLRVFRFFLFLFFF